MAWLWMGLFSVVGVGSGVVVVVVVVATVVVNAELAAIVSNGPEL